METEIAIERLEKAIRACKRFGFGLDKDIARYIKENFENVDDNPERAAELNDWAIVHTQGGDSKFGRWAVSLKGRAWRDRISMEEFYGGSSCWD